MSNLAHATMGAYATRKRRDLAGYSAFTSSQLAGLGDAASDTTKAVQAQLNAWGGSQLSDLVVDGIAGPKTQAKLMEFQRAYGLPETGVADLFTMQALGVNVSYVPPTPTPTPTPQARPSANYVRGGDVIHVEVSARYSYSSANLTANDYKNALQSRLQAAGLQVLQIDTSGLSAISSAVGGYGVAFVNVQPAGDYNSIQDVAGIVAGAMETAGFTVDYGSVRASFLGKSDGVGSNANALADKFRAQPQSSSGFFDDLAKSFGVSTSTAILIGAAAGLGIVLIVSKK